MKKGGGGKKICDFCDGGGQGGPDQGIKIILMASGRYFFKILAWRTVF